MKNLNSFSSILLICLMIACQSAEKNAFQYNIPKGEEARTTTYYFIRHAEKDTSDKGNRDPQLTEQGIKRANYMTSYFEDKNLDLFYYHRLTYTTIVIVRYLH